MHSIHEVRNLPYNSKIIRQVILDIEKYPEFLPWCHHAKILSLDEENHIIAELAISFKGFKEIYKSRIDTDHKGNDYFINVEAISGPFEYLINKWKITDLGDNNSEVDFFIDFKFKSKLLNSFMGMFFTLATKQMVNAFEERVKETCSK
ncbi:MAG: type II toxin-antitoxin system RatA family toxin [Rickettsiaceae bacterium]|nr:type II toxin-antitoxin system RatA family toxin [Rickettsiaceae bacterium]